MKIDIRSPQSLYITINNKAFYIDDSTDEAIMELLEDKRYCKNCGSKLGIDCGDAEPDYNEEFCSKGCYKETKNKNNA
ncbi:MAG: hypothetical protein CMC55_04710 [Flavobacteriaceae bacterium]|nr:hypothetical protein [Flavobacteriaceae bacterium]